MTEIAPALARFAKALVEGRRRRETALGPELFGEPAWDMMLDLFIAAAEGRQVHVSSLCIATAVPQTTALRWITALVDRGLILRRHDGTDRRRVIVYLAPHALAEIHAYLASHLGRMKASIMD